jgi:hypothetical protein
VIRRGGRRFDPISSRVVVVSFHAVTAVRSAEASAACNSTSDGIRMSGF